MVGQSGPSLSSHGSHFENESSRFCDVSSLLELSDPRLPGYSSVTTLNERIGIGMEVYTFV